MSFLKGFLSPSRPSHPITQKTWMNFECTHDALNPVLPKTPIFQQWGAA